MDLLIVFPLGCFMARTESSDELSNQIPKTTLFNVKVLSSVMG